MTRHLRTLLSVILIGALAAPLAHALRPAGLEESGRIKETLVTQLRSASPPIPPASAGMEEVRALLLRWLALPPAPSFFQSPEAQIVGHVAKSSQGEVAPRDDGDRMRQRLVDYGLAALDAIGTVMRVRSTTGPEVKDRLTVIRAKRFRDAPPSPKRDIGPHPFDDGTIFGTGTQDPVYYKLIKLVDDITAAHPDDWPVLQLAYRLMAELYGMGDRILDVSDDDGEGLARVTALLDGSGRLPPMLRGTLLAIREVLIARRLGTVRVALSPAEQTALARLYSSIHQRVGYDPRSPAANHQAFSHPTDSLTGNVRTLVEARNLNIGLYIGENTNLDGSTVLTYHLYVQVHHHAWDAVRLRAVIGDEATGRARRLELAEGFRVPAVTPPFRADARFEQIYDAGDMLTLVSTKSWSVVEFQSRLPALLAAVTHLAPQAVFSATSGLEEPRASSPFLLLAPSAGEQLAGLEEVVEALQRTTVGPRLIVLTEGMTAEEVREAVGPARAQGGRVAIVAGPRDPVAQVAARALRRGPTEHAIEIQFIPPAVLEPWVAQIRHNLGTLGAGGLEEAGHEFLEAVGLAGAA